VTPGEGLVTVVIPLYNNQETVAEAVASALGQTPSPAQVLVVDDGSTDQSRQVVAERFAEDARVKLIAQANGGPSRARNRGIELVETPLLAFLDADDVWLPGKLGRQLEVLGAQEDVGLVACDWMRRMPHSEAAAPELPHLPLTRFTYRDCLILNRFQTSTVVMRTEVARALGGFDPQVDGAEDWDFWVRVAQVTGVVKLDWPLVVYRDVATGYSKDVWRVYETMHLLLDKHRATAPPGFATIEAWHHLRFFVALWLMGDRPRARAAFSEALAPPLRWHVPSAAIRYLLPFLYGRRARRKSGS